MHDWAKKDGKTIGMEKENMDIGYRFIEGYQTPVALKIIKNLNLQIIQNTRYWLW